MNKSEIKKAMMDILECADSLDDVEYDCPQRLIWWEGISRLAHSLGIDIECPQLPNPKSSKPYRVQCYTSCEGASYDFEDYTYAEDASARVSQYKDSVMLRCIELTQGCKTLERWKRIGPRSSDWVNEVGLA